jgi:curli biogenesis system outer membrane secretion channel CsgG
LGGCGYAIQYNLNGRDIVLSKSTAPLKVQVATFSDKREVVERNKSARIEKGETDLTDYTYDREFRGNVAEEVTKMLIKHLNYSKVFASETKRASFQSEQLSAGALDSLGKKGIDAVITGEIHHFFGYYDRSVGRELLYEIPLAVASGMLLTWTTTSGYYQTTYYWYGPGLVLGEYLESFHDRAIIKHVQI